MERLPDKGIYALLIHNPEDARIKVGSLGEIHFRKGYYVYIGSAQKSLRSRIERHLGKEKKLRWHVDYLLTLARVVDFLILKLGKECEEIIAVGLSKEYALIPKFGSSDSRAPSHLFILDTIEGWEKFKERMRDLCYGK